MIGLLSAFLDYNNRKYIILRARDHFFPQGHSTPELIRKGGAEVLQLGEKLHQLMCDLAEAGDESQDWNEHIVQLRRELHDVYAMAHFNEIAPNYAPPWDEDEAGVHEVLS